MSTDEELIDDEHLARLVAYDEALAGTDPAKVWHVAAEVNPGQDEIKADFEFLRLLQRLRPQRQTIHIDGATPDTAIECFRPTEVLPRGLERFEVYRELGGGAFGTVYHAYDTRLRREVALKVPRAGILVTPQLRERFLREARAAAALEHPNLVPVYDAEVSGSVCFIAGPTLAQWLQQRPEPVEWREALTLMLPFVRGVQHAHERGVVHRDLKPSNVLLQRTESSNSSIPTFGSGNAAAVEWMPKVTDFGLAKFILRESKDLTGDRTVVGTRGYMAPEQAMGRSKEVGKAADVYALGAILYELLTGRTPLEAETDSETPPETRSWETPRPSHWRGGIPRALDWVVLKCLERHPARRYADAGELADELVRLLEKQPVRARPAPWTAGVWRNVQRHPARSTAAGFLLALGVLGLAFVGYDVLRDPTPSALKAHYRNLRNGQTVELVGESGGPAWHERATPEKPLAMTWRDGPLRLSSPNGVSRLELLRDPQCLSYRFRAEISHETRQNPQDEKIGVYFGAQQRPDEVGEVYHTFTFADWGRLRGRVGVDTHRRLRPGLNQNDALAKSSEPPKQFEPSVEGGDPPWRSMMVDVTPDRLTVYWDDLTQPLVSLACDAIDERLTRLSASNANMGLPEAVPGFRWAPRRLGALRTIRGGADSQRRG